MLADKAVVFGARWRVVVQKAIRDALGIRPGDTAAQNVVGDRVEIRFFPAVPDEREGRSPPSSPSAKPWTGR